MEIAIDSVWAPVPDRRTHLRAWVRVVRQHRRNPNWLVVHTVKSDGSLSVDPIVLGRRFLIEHYQLVSSPSERD